MTDRTYREQVDPITSDKRDRVIPASNLRKKVLALDVARNAEHLVLHGDFLFADRKSTGQVDVQLNSTAEDSWPMTAQDGVRDMPIRDVFITHAAQAGKVLNLWYGYRARFLAGANSIASIGSILDQVSVQGPHALFTGPALADLPVLMREVGDIPGVTFWSGGAQTANAALNIWAAASNVNGVLLHEASFCSQSGSSTALATMLAKATAPAGPGDGTVIVAPDQRSAIGANWTNNARIGKRTIVAAGLRLDFISDTLEALSPKHARFSFL